MSNSNPNQCKRLLGYMRTHKGITQFEAIGSLGILRLASRISELKKDGNVIDSERIKVTNRFGETCYVSEYRLVKEVDND